MIKSRIQYPSHWHRAWKFVLFDILSEHGPLTAAEIRGVYPEFKSQNISNIVDSDPTVFVKFRDSTTGLFLYAIYADRL